MFSKLYKKTVPTYLNIKCEDHFYLLQFSLVHWKIINELETYYFGCIQSLLDNLKRFLRQKKTFGMRDWPPETFGTNNKFTINYSFITDHTVSTAAKYLTNLMEYVATVRLIGDECLTIYIMLLIATSILKIFYILTNQS